MKVWNVAEMRVEMGVKNREKSGESHKSKL
jgi:hypothetical protein